MSQQVMKQDWDARAQEPSTLYLDNRARSEEEFRALGEADARMILADVEADLSPEARVLEIGCGVGRILEHMARRFREAWGVDVSPEMIRRGRERLSGLDHVRFVETGGSDLAGVPDAYFDFCYSYFTFRHLTEHRFTEAYVREAFRVLRPGGILKIEASGVYATNPFREFYDGQANSWQGVRFTMSEIVRVVEAAGFQMIAAYHPRAGQQALATDAVHEDVERQRRLWVVARKDDGMDEWEAVCHAAGRALGRTVPAGGRVLLPECELENHLALAGASGVSFIYLAAPDDEAGAVELLERHRAAGGEFLLLSRYGQWWLEVYPGLAAHLGARYRVAHESAECVIFDLREGA